MKSNFISINDWMPGHDTHCLLKVRTNIEFKDGYRCGKECHPFVEFYINYNMDYGMIGPESMENGMLITLDLEFCENNKKFSDERNHKIKDMPATMTQLLELITPESSTWEIGAIQEWMILEENDYHKGKAAHKKYFKSESEDDDSDNSDDE